MLLYLINPSNSFSSLAKVKENIWNHYRVWKPLSLLVLAGLTPADWDISIIDENIMIPDYFSIQKPDLVGITAFTSQAPRAYDIAAIFKNINIPVIMGGIHATMCMEEALQHVDSIVKNEAESVWRQLLDDFKNNNLKKLYEGGYADLTDIPLARHNLLNTGYAFGAIQTTRGCPLKCSFCSVTNFNGAHYRQRPIDDVINEFKLIKEKLVLVVDDNLIGTKAEHIERAKELFRSMIKAKLKKKWITQVTINFADDDELLNLASKAGCLGVFIGFETFSEEGLLEIGKKFNLKKGRDFRASVRRIQKSGISVVGSFIIGLDIDKPGIGKHIAKIASCYGVDQLNALFLTPLPGTKLWEKLVFEKRILLNSFPEHWKYFTLNYPVAKYKNFLLIK